MFVHTALSLGLLLISNAVISQSSTVLTVSPGGLQEPTQITDACPTFSWGRATGANRYQVAVFDAMENDSLDYAEQLAMADPIIQTSIDAPALSWTPAADQCLNQGGSYLWFIQATTADGVSDWSQGRRFEIDLQDSILAEAVRQEITTQLSQPDTWRRAVQAALQNEPGVALRLPHVAGVLPAKALTRAGVTGDPASNLADSGILKEGVSTEAVTFTNPSAFRVSGSNGVLFDAPTLPSGNGIPAEGSGVRFMWYPGKASLRSGRVDGGLWDDANIGFYSTAMGRNNTASGDYSTAMGAHTRAKSSYETVIGRYNMNYDPASATGWAKTDRLFVIGNGTGFSSRSDAMVVLKNGNIGIGTSVPTAKLYLVSKDSTAPLQLEAAGTSEHMRLAPRSSFPAGATEGDIHANTNGALYYRSNSTWTAMNSAADFSELIIPLGSAIEAHDGAGTYEGEIGFSEIISINDNGHYTRCRVPYDERISGIESGDRGIYYLPQGSLERLEGQRQFGAIGHVKLKVSAENGSIKPGDFLTCSGSQPGIGMKATGPGRVASIAKEAFDGMPGQIGLIEVFVNPHTWLADATPAVAAVNKEVAALRQEVLSLREELQQYRKLTLEVAELKRQISRSSDLLVARNR